MIKSKYFWVLQIIGWTLFAFLAFLINVQSIGSNWATYVVIFSVFLGGFGWTTLYRFVIHRLGWKKLPLRRIFLRILLASLIISVIWTATFLGVYYLTSYFGATVKFTPQLFFANLINSFIVIISWSVIYFGVNLFNESQRMRVEKYKLESAFKDAQLSILKSQINPHFMFNALNNIRALMLENVEKSREMLTSLSELLRYSLVYGNNKTVTLGEELDIVRNYIALNTIQFEDRLKYSIEVDPASLSVTIPPMIIQILIENAIKHGISQYSEGGKISITVQIDEDYLNITVANTGTLQKAGGQSTNGSQIGLKNIHERLQLLYSGKADFKLSEKNNQVIATIMIPQNLVEYEEYNN